MGIDTIYGQEIAAANRPPSQESMDWVEDWYKNGPERLAKARAASTVGLPTGTTHAEAIRQGIPPGWAVPALDAEVADRINSMVANTPEARRAAEAERYSREINRIGEAAGPQGMPLESFVDQGRQARGLDPKLRPPGYKNSGTIVRKTPNGWQVIGAGSVDPVESTQDRKQVDPGGGFDAIGGGNAMPPSAAHFSVPPEGGIRVLPPNELPGQGLGRFMEGIIPDAPGEVIRRNQPKDLAIEKPESQQAPPWQGPPLPEGYTPDGFPEITPVTADNLMGNRDIRYAIKRLGYRPVRVNGKDMPAATALSEYLRGNLSAGDVPRNIRDLAEQMKAYNANVNNVFHAEVPENIARSYSATHSGWVPRTKAARLHPGMVNFIRASPANMRRSLREQLLEDDELYRMSFRPESIR